ncbi:MULTISPECIES: DUF3667 domain-containing protein [Rufibacter]|uniref:Magnesium-transporting ATPase (P-type) n=1 Tax=Rufibacter quisquiliarum TaxID=1549639 RepID=A0A839GLY8_9BACT|nr:MULTISPECIES: DUF3667 domain-containing protein [Rufibacter]MBA9079730.1 magnesium-transporting ATPase (P-type) [Rufibacter quisquiliarum]
MSVMLLNCKNCEQTLAGNFCAVCGQKKYKRIDRHYLWEEFQYTVLHTNKGLLYSIKSVLRNPGKTAKEYIDGHRVNHYKPILLVFVLSGIATFLSFKVLNLKEVMAVYFAQQNVDAGLVGTILSFMSSYSSMLMLLYVPLFALTTKIAFRKWGHNYYEHVVMNAYILSFYTLVSIIFAYPIMFIFRHSPEDFYTVTQISILAVPVILVFFFKEVYQGKPLKSIVLRVIGVMCLALLGYILFIIVAGIIGFAIAMLKGPEALEMLKTK